MLVILIDVKVRIKFLITMVYWTKWVLTKVSKKAKIKKMEECAAGFMRLWGCFSNREGGVHRD